jgi:hypothetical protein
MVAAPEVKDMAIAMLRNGYLTNKVVTLDGAYCRAGLATCCVGAGQ